jgi:nucleotide-binding universal stress UspA family protein
LKDAAEICDTHGFEVKTDAVEGQARSDLLPFARENNTDLIVMGNSVNKVLLKRLPVDTVLDSIKSADRPFFLSQ